MSDRQLSAADPAVSAWVSASAGTGKTHVLTSRVLRLLLAGTDPQKILCLTFTKAAAAEMANRVQETLARWVTFDDTALDQALITLGITRPVDLRPRARRLFAEVLDCPGGLKIQTIHAFCQSLLARFPLEAQLPPHFQLIDERSAAEALNDAVNDVMLDIDDHDSGHIAAALARISRRMTEYSFIDFVAALVRERGLLERMRRAYTTVPGMMVATARVLGLRGDETADTILQNFRTASDRDGLRRAVTALSAGGKTDNDRAALIRAWLQDDNPNAESFAAYRKAYLTQKNTILAKLATNKIAAENPWLVTLLQDEADRFLKTDETLRLVDVLDNTMAALTFVFAVLELYGQDKRRDAVLDYDDLILGVLRLLHRSGIAPWVLYKLDGGLTHILIDEAQDTNPEQWQVVRTLADEFFTGQSARDDETRTIFAVGDVKQSIYRFQRAEPREFIGARDHFKGRVEQSGGQFRNVSLDLSYRSTAAVLTFVDAVFSDPQLRAHLLDAEYIGHDTVRRGMAGVVELWQPEQADPVHDDSDGWALPVDQTTRASAEARLALKIARTIRHWLDSGDYLPARGRAMRPGDILILVRRRSSFDSLLLSALKMQGVPVAGADRMVVTEQLAVMDLMALARFTLLPDDDLTLATVLKSPLCGLSEDDLYALATARGDRSLWAELSARADYQRVRARLADCLTTADYLSPFDFFSRVLNTLDAYGLSGRDHIIARLGSEAHDPIDEFLSLALVFEQTHTASMQSFLHWLDARRVEIKRDMDQGRDEVRIMTVHGAKGLQAPVVIMPDTCQVPKMRQPLVEILDPYGTTQRLLLWPGKSDNAVGPCGDARERMKTLEREEQARLLYVALTRAADRLYIGGWVGPKGKDTDCWHTALEDGMRRLDGVIEIDSPDGPILRYETEQTVATRSDTITSDHARHYDLPPWIKTPAPDEPTPSRPLAPSRPLEDEPAALSPLKAAAARARDNIRFRRGTLIHKLLERLPPLARADRLAAAQRFLLEPALALDMMQIDAIIAEVMMILDHPDFADLFSPAAQAEAPLTGVVGTTAIAAQVDRLLVTNDRVVVVDYKTNRPPPQTVDGVQMVYLRQMAAYRHLLRAIYPGRMVTTALLWTDGATLMPLPDHLLDQVVL